MDDEKVNRIIALLGRAQDLIAADAPDGMDVTEWNATSGGKAVGLIAQAIEMLEEDDE